MLAKNRRIKKELFQTIFQKGSHFQSSCLALKTIPKLCPKSSFAFIVSAGMIKKAVARNKLKRRARAIIFKTLSSLKEGHCVVFIFKKGSQNLSFKEMESEMVGLLRKAKLLH
jgi:ribonuclease P protein component